ncbi:N-acetylglucosamine-6-phosphate deacetylase [Methylorubrum extorquens]|uniref:N-acetylglucosamine-6-phosphate deacetylase n=1 Tax=Methylorubrum extorquens TaxID=408 RepID=UPI000158EE17|nr:N-acetylglucosamine-6-phosphate deacetylase [Methylorubrum extorquens]ABY32694.1 N-acetylglucosamine-6-phosphate deacetylase [Methylorubrum extorquens PA1]KQP95606.1 N-acetylglucosamine-6-phosphate deacetylase [Methylobacterium sp. Leaf119]WIU39292.1 N-acetylglucosamine-6-phosphate deacetylase [Methylorubrum extorquens]
MIPLGTPYDQAICADRVFDGERMLGDRTVVLRGGHIVDVTAEPPADVPLVRLPAGAVLAPGFIDCQVNGGGGVLLNDDSSVAGIARIAAAHRRGGTTALLPTLITDTRPAIRAAIAGVAAAIQAGVPGILGIHLEGPFLSPQRIGIHDPSRLAEFGPGDAELLTSLGEHGLTLVTLAPERVPAGAVADLVARGARVCAGHTADAGSAIRAAMAEGLTGFTHLFNAMSQIGPRETGAVGVALSEAETFAGIIADGHHVGDDQLRLALRLKGSERLMLVSDAMPPVGDTRADASFTLFGRRVVRTGDRLTGEDGTLAGAAITMAEAVRHMSTRGGASLAEALAMASLTPARFLGLDARLGRIAPGFAADLVALSADRAVLGTWIGGEQAV